MEWSEITKLTAPALSIGGFSGPSLRMGHTFTRQQCQYMLSQNLVQHDNAAELHLPSFRLMVDAACFSCLATQRMDSPAASALEISSRPAIDKTKRERYLSGGLMPHASLSMF